MVLSGNSTRSHGRICTVNTRSRVDFAPEASIGVSRTESDWLVVYVPFDLCAAAAFTWNGCWWCPIDAGHRLRSIEIGEHLVACATFITTTDDDNDYVVSLSASNCIARRAHTVFWGWIGFATPTPAHRHTRASVCNMCTRLPLRLTDVCGHLSEFEFVSNTDDDMCNLHGFEQTASNPIQPTRMCTIWIGRCHLYRFDEQKKKIESPSFGSFIHRNQSATV